MSFIAYAWLTSIVYGLGSVVGKIASRHHIANPWLYNIVWWIVTVVSIIPLAVLGGVGWPQDWTSIIWLSVANAVSGAAFIVAFYAVDLSILSPLSILRVPIAALIGAGFLGESLSLTQQSFIGVLFLAGLFVQMDENFSLKSFWSKGTLLSLIWVLTSVWFNSMISVASMHNGYWEVVLWSNVIGLVLTLVTVPLFFRDLSKTPVSRYSGIVISTLLYTAGMLFSVVALAENVSISMAIISLPLALLMTMALSVVAPKLLEKHSAKVYAVRLGAAVVMFAAGLGLSK